MRVLSFIISTKERRFMSLIDSSNIKIQISLVDSPKLLARVTVVLFGIWEEHGWRVMPSSKMHPKFCEQLWIQAPSFPVTNKNGSKGWKESIFISDRDIWELVHEKIYDAYHMARSKQQGQTGVQEKEHKAKQEILIEQRVNVDDIPF